MKKLFLLIILYLGVFPVIKNGKIRFGTQSVHAASFSDEWDDGGGDGGDGGDDGGDDGGTTVNMSNTPSWGADMAQSYTGSCTFMNMEVIGDILGVDVTEDGLISAYATANGETVTYVEENGIPVTIGDYSALNNFVAQSFNETSIATSSISTSIDNGNPCMAFVLTGVDMNSGSLIGHEITVYSYSTDNSGNTTYNYVDTSDGSSHSGNGANFGDVISLSKK